MEKIINILGALQQRLKVQGTSRQTKGLEQKELDVLKASYLKQGVTGEAIDRVHGFLVRLLESNQELIAKEDFTSDFKQQLKKPFVDLMLEFDKCMPDNVNKLTEKEKNDSLNLLNKILEWVAENKTVELYDLSTKISSLKKLDEKLALIYDFLKTTEKEIPENIKSDYANTVNKLEKVIKAPPSSTPEPDGFVERLKEIARQLDADKKEKVTPKESTLPVVGMVVSGLVTLFGLYKSTSSDEKSLPYGLTILGLIGLGASAIWKWGWPKNGGRGYSSGSSSDFIAGGFMNDQHYGDWGHSHDGEYGDCGDSGGSF